MMAGVMQPEIIEAVCLWLGGSRRDHMNGAPCGSVGSGDMVWVSSFCTCAITSAGSTTRRSEASSLRMERSVGRGWVFFASAAVRRIDCRAIFGFFKNIRSRAFPYLIMRWLRACLSSMRVVRPCALKHAFARLVRSGDGLVSASSAGTFVRLSASKFRIGGEAAVRRVNGVVTMSHSWCCGESVLEMDSILRRGVEAANAARRRKGLVKACAGRSERLSGWQSRP